MSIANPGNRAAAKRTYDKQMGDLKARYREAQKGGKKRLTLNPFKAQGFGI